MNTRQSTRVKYANDEYTTFVKKTLTIICNKKNKDENPMSDDNEEITSEKNKKDENNPETLEFLPTNQVENVKCKRRKRKKKAKSTYCKSFNSNQIRDWDDPRQTNTKINENGKNQNKGKYSKIMQIPLQDSPGICVFYLQGACQKDDCLYSHEAVPPIKLELCKFYLMDCCTRGDKCMYLHSEFPCKFYHMGLTCTQADNCKFAHGKPLSEGLKQILFKTTETEVFGGLSKTNQEETVNIINGTQIKTQEQSVESKPMVKVGVPPLFNVNVPVPNELLQGCNN